MTSFSRQTISAEDASINVNVNVKKLPAERKNPIGDEITSRGRLIEGLSGVNYTRKISIITSVFDKKTLQQGRRGLKQCRKNKVG